MAEPENHLKNAREAVGKVRRRFPGSQGQMLAADSEANVEALANVAQSVDALNDTMRDIRDLFMRVEGSDG